MSSSVVKVRCPFFFLMDLVRISGQDVEIAIVGYDNSTQVQSLLPAFESLNITTTLPGLKSSLLLSGALMSELFVSDGLFGSLTP